MPYFSPLRGAAAIAFPVVAAACWVVAQPAGAGEAVEAGDIVGQLSLPRSSRGIGVVPAEGFRKIALPAIRFEFDSGRLTPAALAQVEELATALNLPALRRSVVAVEGHTDSSGSASYNRALSLRRAQAVKRQLIGMGVSGHRVVEVGLGESFPVQGIASSDGRNRRVEIVNLGNRAVAAVDDRERVRPARRRALLIGIDAYRHVSSLRGPVNDALSMASFLTEHAGYRDPDVRTLLDEEATRANVLAAIEDWLVVGTVPGDEAFLFFSGHGFQQPDESGDEADRRDETWVPVDASVENGVVKGMIVDDEVAVLMKRLSGRRVQVVIDACHSGTSVRGGPRPADWRHVKTPRLPDGTALRVSRTRGLGGMAETERFLFSDDPDLTVWTAVRADQKALVDQEARPDEPGSVFTRRFLRGVRDGEARGLDDEITAEELHEYVKQESNTYCERHRDVCASGLSPQLHAAARRLGEPAFSGMSLPHNAVLAKDILVRPLERWTTDGNSIRLTLEPGPRLEVGAEHDILVESDRDGHLLLLDIDAAGKLTQIFPNAHSIAGGVPDRIKAGEPVRLPGSGAGFRFRALPPAGRGLLIAVVSDGDARLRNLASRYKELSVVPRPRAYLVETGEALLGGAAAGGDGGWLATVLTYEIVPPTL